METKRTRSVRLSHPDTACPFCFVVLSGRASYTVGGARSGGTGLGAPGSPVRATGPPVLARARRPNWDPGAPKCVFSRSRNVLLRARFCADKKIPVHWRGSHSPKSMFFRALVIYAHKVVQGMTLKPLFFWWPRNLQKLGIPPPPPKSMVTFGGGLRK